MTHGWYLQYPCGPGATKNRFDIELLTLIFIEAVCHQWGVDSRREIGERRLAECRCMFVLMACAVVQQKML